MQIYFISDGIIFIIFIIIFNVFILSMVIIKWVIFIVCMVNIFMRFYCGMCVYMGYLYMGKWNK